MISELRHRDPFLFWIGAAMLLTLTVVTLLSISDSRLILGINPWIKPMKFLTSITIFLWTVAWFMPEARPSSVASGFLTTEASAKVVSRIDKRQVVRWTIAVAMIVEIACIILQSARGTTSHYNITSPFDAAIFSIMGTTIFINTIAMALFLWIIRRDTPEQRAGYLWGVRIGVAIFLLASLEGVLLVVNGAHTVGAPDGGPGLPFVNWSTRAGDLRVAHFFGMHGMQALPLIGFVLDKSLPAEAHRAKAGNLVMMAGILWVAVMTGLLMMALQGRPLLAI